MNYVDDTLTLKAKANYAPLNRDTTNLKAKTSYGLLDAAGNILYVFTSTYILYFYTDIAGLGASVAGLILLLVRVFDSIDAPIWGLIIDRTKSKYGKCRPWFIRLIIPYAIFTVLAFYNPDLPPTQKAIYFCVTYLVSSIIFTGVNTPISAILPLLTKSPAERLVLNSFRLVGGNAGTLFMNLTALPLVAYLGSEDKSIGFLYTAIFFSCVYAILTLIAFFYVKEIPQTEEQKTQKIPFKYSFLAMKGNWPWLIMLVSNLLFWTGYMGRCTSAIYYVTYYLEKPEYVSIVNGLLSVMLIAMIAIPFFCKFVSKTTLWLIGLLIAILGSFIMYFAGTTLVTFLVGWVISSFGLGIAISMPFAMFAFAADYSEWKMKIVAPGVLIAFGTTFCIKMGSGLGSFITAFTMDISGYIPNVTQTAESLFGISFALLWGPVVIFILAAIPLFFYKKYENMEGQIQKDLLEQRQS